MVKKVLDQVRKRRALSTGVVVFLVVVLILSTYFYIQYRNAQKQLQNPQQAAEKEAAKLLDKVDNLMDLPNETPKIAIVSDKTKVQSTLPFRNVEKNDRVLFYEKAGRVVLFRPSTGKIIDVLSVNLSAIQDAVASSSASQGQQEIVTVSVYNGTVQAGLAGDTGTIITEKYPNVTLGTLGNATNNYSKTVVIDLIGSNKVLTQNLAQLLNGSVGKLPEGEQKPQGDILVIVGK